MKNINQSISKIIFIVLFICVVVASVVFLIITGYKTELYDNAPEIEHVTVLYSFDENCCQFIGKNHQYIVKGEDAESVTVVPKIGFKFLGWVDVESQDVLFDTEKLSRQDMAVQCDLWLIARFIGPVYSNVVFAAGKGGTVEGKLEQSVLYGGKGERVTAIPDEGYRFVKWTDGETEAVRENLTLCHYSSFPRIYAEFERYSRKFEFIYNDGVAESGETEIEITLDNIDEVTLPVPERENCEFEGWYSDWHHEIKVSDNNGQMIVGLDWLNNDYLYNNATNPEGYLYAKWKTTNKIPTYKILMIYISEVHGDFTFIDSQNIENIRVDYVMSDIHMKICNQITEFMDKYLNAIFNETVRFEVDQYFTKDAVNEKVFGTGDGKYYLPIVYAENGIAETKEIIKEYDSVLTVYSLCGYENGLKLTGNHAGSASAKFGSIVLDVFLYRYYDKDMDEEYRDLENLFDYSFPPSFFAWEDNLDTYIHEFIHTVERQVDGLMDNVDMHSALKYNAEKYGTLKQITYDVYTQYLLNKFEVDNGDYWGIPYEFWIKKDQERNQATL